MAKKRSRNDEETSADPSYRELRLAADGRKAAAFTMALTVRDRKHGTKPGIIRSERGHAWAYLT
jgi:hypothetical protein